MGKPRTTTKLTEKIVERLKPRQVLWDREVRGFGVRRQKTQKTFVLKCLANGRQRYFTIGHHQHPWTVETARAEARAMLVRNAKGDPAKEEHPSDTLNDLCDRYLREHCPRKKPSSAKSDEGLIKNYVRPLLGSKPLVAITRADIQRFQDDVRTGATAPKDRRAQQLRNRGGKVVTGGKGVSNRAITLLSKMFNLAEDWGIRQQNSNPARRIKKYPEVRRNRFLSSDELARLGAKLRDAERDDPYAVAALRLLILTGARLGEVLTLRWAWVDLDRRVLNLPDSKTGQKVIRLSDPALDVLSKLRRRKDNPYVVVGSKPGRHLINLEKYWHRYRTAAGIEHARIHDLRHTFASIALREGYSLSVTGALLGHSSNQTTERYAHLQQDQVWHAGQAIGIKIGSLLMQSAGAPENSSPLLSREWFPPA